MKFVTRLKTFKSVSKKLFVFSLRRVGSFILPYYYLFSSSPWVSSSLLIGIVAERRKVYGYKSGKCV